MIMPKTGDIVHINMALVFPRSAYEYDAIVLWNSFNNQPLLTKVGEYRPFWASYEEIEKVIGHIDIDVALNGAIPVSWVEGLMLYGDPDVSKAAWRVLKVWKGERNGNID